MQDFITFLSNHAQLTTAACVLIVALLFVEFLRAKRNTFNIDTAAAIQLINRENAVVIDLRADDLYRKGHITDAKSMTAQEMQTHPQKLDKFKNKPLLLVCSTGLESQKVAAQLKKQGYNAYSLTGGMRAWSQADIPVVKE